MGPLIPKCDMLIDQGKHIGADPVGRCCLNDATHMDGEYYVCDECLESLRRRDGRVTIPRSGTVRLWSTDPAYFPKIP